MKALYFDCFAGASGNMILGALVALGVDENELIEQLKFLDVSDFEIKFRSMDKSGISAIHAEVKYAPEHAHRHLRDIEKIINDSRLKDSVKKRAIQIFTRLAEAEAKVHGTSVEKIHFHEVGAMDAIIDVVGACIGFEMLGIEKFYCSKIHTGSGFVKMAHGKFPVPPPAVAEILQSVSAPIYQTEIEGELITPTGAAIIATVCDSFGAMPEMQIEKAAYGAGTRGYKDFPNALRLILGESNTAADTKKQFLGEHLQPAAGHLQFADEESHARDTHSQSSDADSRAMEADSQVIDADSQPLDEHLQSSAKNSQVARDQKNTETQILTLIETNLDDSSPEILGYVMERAFELGALDCWFTPIQMKKNRPATMISILCLKENKETFTELLYTETTTLGVRVSEIERECLPRETIRVETKFGAVDVKIAKYNGAVVNAKPEYEQIRQIALQSKKSLREVEREVSFAVRKKLAYEEFE